MMGTVAAFAAETHYDKALERAAMDIVASRIGDIRGGFSYSQRPSMVAMPETPPAPDAASEPARREAVREDAGPGLVPAVERNPSPTLF